VQIENFVYPPYSIPLAEAYDGRFESVYIVLHPFVRVPHSLAWNVTQRYPDDAQIAALGSKYSWTEVAAETGLSSCARLNQALLTSICSLADHLADPHASDTLQTFLQSKPIWMPVEGRFATLLQPDILHAFESAGARDLIYVPEFPNSDPYVTLSIEGLRNGNIPFPACGTLLAPEASFLITVDWDSFFTLLYGPRAFITQVAAERNLEGFFAAPITEHTWFNYSMGCATVTLSPEHWQTR
jgi:hypothetical protein